jgi:hypothetical protein
MYFAEHLNIKRSYRGSLTKECKRMIHEWDMHTYQKYNSWASQFLWESLRSNSQISWDTKCDQDPATELLKQIRWLKSMVWWIWSPTMWNQNSMPFIIWESPLYILELCPRQWVNLNVNLRSTS